MTLFAALILAAATPAVPISPEIAGGPPSELACPVVHLTDGSRRVANLSATDLATWRGPLVELQLSLTGDEAGRLGKLGFVRINGAAYGGGQFRRRVDDAMVETLVLSFDADIIASLASAPALELVGDTGSLMVGLAAGDAAALQTCLADNAMPAAPASDPLTRRNFTFVRLGADQPLRIRSRRDPSLLYPAQALHEAREGTSRVAVVIGANGRIDTCIIVTSSGHADLDAASCRAARTSTFLPATDAKGDPVETKVEQNLVWKMSD